jgi:hypothetical protein
MTGPARPDLRGRLRAAGSMTSEAILGSRLRRWSLSVATFAIVAVVAAAAALVGLPFAVGMALALAAAVVGGLWLALALTPAADRPVAGSYLIGGRRELARYRRATGRRLPPRTRWGMARWVRDSPDEPATRPIRATFLIGLGRYDEAARTIEVIDPSGPVERFERARLWAIVDFERGGAGDLGPVRRAFGAIDDPVDRSVAAWQLAVEDARQRYVLGGDWRAPLALAAGSGDQRARSVRAWLPTVLWGAAPILLVIYVLALVVELVATGSIV